MDTVYNLPNVRLFRASVPSVCGQTAHHAVPWDGCWQPAWLDTNVGRAPPPGRARVPAGPGLWADGQADPPEDWPAADASRSAILAPNFKSYEWIFMKFGEPLDYGPEKTW